MHSQNSFILYQYIENIPGTSFTVIDKSNVNLERKDWSNNKVTDLWPFIVQWKSKSISFEKNEKSGIIRDLYGIQFSCLVHLRLDGNKIQSIQGLSQIKLAKLKKIWLSKLSDYTDNNKISNLTDFRKIQSPQLSFISLNNNPINELNSLSELNANVETFCLQSCFTHLVCHNISWANKIQTEKLKEIWIQSAQRICQNKVAIALKKKYPEGKIWKLR